ncbi:hypothetical protein T265_03159 [Opisthorchis viverrini]|uniref:Uncharacterized protein n=1 Tax=Opisthorchis viverrini TaxID=6198 RepID=A0A075A4A7_OPIVI|nr:hypothetical protein T265_03159 [Opisthorchis viverrini]KER30425.1 hypothetical protein T265_03159 [Opisthorchis viverrini]
MRQGGSIWEASLCQRQKVVVERATPDYLCREVTPNQGNIFKSLECVRVRMQDRTGMCYLPEVCGQYPGCSVVGPRDNCHSVRRIADAFVVPGATCRTDPVKFEAGKYDVAPHVSALDSNSLSGSDTKISPFELVEDMTAIQNTVGERQPLTDKNNSDPETWAMASILCTNS